MNRPTIFDVVYASVGEGFSLPPQKARATNGRPYKTRIICVVGEGIFSRERKRWCAHAVILYAECSLIRGAIIYIFIKDIDFFESLRYNKSCGISKKSER